jgi:hypothetical protein
MKTRKGRGKGTDYKQEKTERTAGTRMQERLIYKEGRKGGKTERKMATRTGKGF